MALCLGEYTYNFFSSVRWRDTLSRRRISKNILHSLISTENWVSPKICSEDSKVRKSGWLRVSLFYFLVHACFVIYMPQNGSINFISSLAPLSRLESKTLYLQIQLIYEYFTILRLLKPIPMMFSRTLKFCWSVSNFFFT